MQFRDLKKQYAVLKDEIDQSIAQVLSRGDYIMGSRVDALERKLEEYTGAGHCITCGNGTDALELALLAWQVKEDEAVFVPDFTFFSSGEAVVSAGAVPVFVDVDGKSFHLSPQKLDEAVRRTLREGILKPRAVMAVDLFGQPADYDGIREVAEKYGLLVLEDGAQGFGGEYFTHGRWRRACSLGDISTTSFFPAKPLGCYGDGGAVFTDNEEWAARIRSLKIHGKGKDKYDNVRIGRNSRLDTIQAAILEVKLKAFQEQELKSVNGVAKQYEAAFLKDGNVICPGISENCKSSFAQYTIKLKNAGMRDFVQEELKKNGIPSMIYYKKPMHRQKAFDDGGKYEDFCTQTLRLCGQVLSLPVHPYMTPEDTGLVAEKVCRAAEKWSGERG